MELNIEMIEQVIDAAGADYYTAKEALQEHDGNVEEAISAIKEKAEQMAAAAEAAKEEAAQTASSAAESAKEADQLNEGQENGPDQGPEAGAAKGQDPVEELFSDEYADRVVGRLKERVKAGNVDLIRISREGKTLLEIPVNVGVIGGLLGLLTVPWAMIIGVVTAYGFNCKIEVIKSDGTSEDLSQ